VALDDVTFEIAAGSCHALCGENGAGKSTLSRILAGLQRPDAGTLLVHGKPVEFHGPSDAAAAGIAMVPQELLFCDNLSVAENLFLGALPSRGGWLARDELHANARALLESIGARIDPARCIETLSIAQQQLVQIAAAVGSGARVIIFDEPTSSLGEREVEQLDALIETLRARGVTMIYISHRMPEIFRLCDAVTVLRDGKHVVTAPTATFDEATLVQRMIGRRLEQYFPAHARQPPGDEVLRVAGLSSRGKFRDVSFTLRAGEVVGVAGLVGAGRSELAQALFGLDRHATGSLFVRGTRVEIGSPRDAMAHGIGLVPEDRKRQGLVLAMRSRENVTLPSLRRLAHLGWISRGAELAVAGEQLQRLQVRETALETPSMTLSGGNQQKVVLAKWLAAGSTILILDEPTRGVDVGAKAELHAWIDEMAAGGAAVLLISSELPELLNLSRRILVMRGGELVGEVARELADQDALLRLMAGIQAA
jgi:ABC-type sugar transport system ATPase subunit